MTSLALKEEQADKHSLAVPANVERTALAAHLEGTENPKVHGSPLSKSQQANDARNLRALADGQPARARA